VTLIIGIVCKDGIVMAADSQTTWDTGKSWAANKMTGIRTRRGGVMVAESGSTLTSGKMLDEFAAIMENDALRGEKSFDEVAQLAAMRTRETLRRQQFDCSSEELRKFIFDEGLDATLMFAHYRQGKPQIGTIALDKGVYERGKHFFTAVGSGSDLARYLLSNLCLPDNKEMDCEEASVVAVHVVDTVKEHDQYCGGKTRLGIIRDHYQLPSEGLTITNEAGEVIMDDVASVFIPPESTISQLSQTARNADLATKYQRWAFITKALTDESRRRIKLFTDIAREIKNGGGKKKRKKP
jgi:20S proteasome alpha/beta subunit